MKSTLTAPDSSKPSFPISFVLAAFGFTWTFWLIAWLFGRSVGQGPLQLTLLVIGGFGPTLMACVFVAQREGWRNAAVFLGRGFNPRFPLPMLAFVVLIPLVVNGAAYFTTGGRRIETNLVHLVGTYVLWFFFGGPFNEDYGWRGYVLPRLLAKWNPVIASLLLGFLWSAWHWPLFYLTGTTQSQTPLWVFFLSTTAQAIVYTWIWNQAGKKLLPVMLYHSFSNISVVVFPQPHIVGGIDRSTYVEALLALSLALTLVLLYGKRLGIKEAPDHTTDSLTLEPGF
jgi:hypothetical protein